MSNYEIVETLLLIMRLSCLQALLSVSTPFINEIIISMFPPKHLVECLAINSQRQVEDSRLLFIVAARGGDFGCRDVIFSHLIQID